MGKIKLMAASLIVAASAMTAMAESNPILEPYTAK